MPHKKKKKKKKNRSSPNFFQSDLPLLNVSDIRYQISADWLERAQWSQIDWLSMVLRLQQHNIGYTANGFYRSDDPTNSVKALKEGGYSHPDRPRSNQAQLTVLQ